MTIAVLVAILPVSAFLLVLVLSDSFKLVSRGMLIRALVAGAGAALIGAAHQSSAAGGRSRESHCQPLHRARGRGVPQGGLCAGRRAAAQDRISG